MSLLNQSLIQVHSEKKAQKYELSLVIPVYNGSQSIESLVEKIHTIFHDYHFEVILVNDGSQDASELVCSKLVDRFSDTVIFSQLSRNFGEHNVVLVGLNLTRGECRSAR